MFRRIAVPLLSMVLSAAGSTSAFASGQVDSLNLKIYFREGSTYIERSYRDNAYELDSFKLKLREIKDNKECRIISATINASGSPTGNSVRNKEIADLRANSLNRTSRSWFDGTGIRPVVNKGEIGWRTLAEEVKTSDIPYKDEVLDIIYNTPVWIRESSGAVVGSRKLTLMDLHDGIPYRYMEDYLFSECRWASITVAYEAGENQEIEDEQPEKEDPVDGEVQPEGQIQETESGIEPAKPVEAGANEVQPTEVTPEPEPTSGSLEPVKMAKAKEEEPVVEEPVDAGKEDVPDPVPANTPVAAKTEAEPAGYYEPSPVAAPKPVRDQKGRKPAYVNFRTNLLYDLALVPNVGLEFHLGHNWSMGINWEYAWWEIDKYSFCEQIYGGEIYFRKYMGKKAKEKPLTGHHLGINLQAITYDVDWKFSRVGYQGRDLFREFPGNWSVGIEYGYSVPVGRRVNLDFTIGAGYFYTEYKTYVLRHDNNNRPDQREVKKFEWWGPTKVEVTLVCLMGYGNYNVTKRHRK